MHQGKREGFFKGDNTPPLLPVLFMVPLMRLTRKAKGGYKWGNKGLKLNCLLFMSDLKLFAKSKN